MKKLSKKISLVITSSILSIATGISIALPISNSALLNSSITNITSKNQATESSPVIPSEVNDQNANISTKNGPVTFLGNKITALDWFGNKLWDIDFTTLIPDQNGNKNEGQQSQSLTYSGPWSRAWFNWDYNRNTDLIWILGYWSNNKKTQPLLGIQASNGQVKHTYNLSYDGVLNNVGTGTAYRFVSALSSGKVMVYGGAGSPYDAKGILYDPDSNSTSVISGDSAKNEILPTNDETYGKKYRWYFFNLIPIGNNKNLVEVLPFSRDESVDDGGFPNANYNVYFLLVDDKLNMIHKEGTWSKLVKVADGMQNYRNTKITPQRDYYTMLDGKVVTVVYNTAIVIDGKNDNIQFGVYPMSEKKWIKSWAFDSNQNLYFKFKDESKVYKVSGSVWQTLNNSTTNSNVPLDLYLDLAGIQDIKSYANDLIMYNVYGYTGQLMMINSKYNAKVDTTNSTITVDTNDQKYGLAIAVNQNSSNQTKGDYKGMLNGDNSFQKTSNFELSASAKSSKIPSEITKEDIVASNGFLKNPSDFTIKEMDDKTGTIKIECKLYQVPWFTDKLPDDISPKIIEHEYKTDKTISDKTSWKNLTTSTDYDFLNMKPTTIQKGDVENLDPFQVSFQSQTIVDKNGNTLYPKKTYDVKDKDDAKGTVKVTVKYEYIPMGITYKDSTSVRSYDAETTYNVFKSSTTPAFKFMGQTNSEPSINIQNVSELKNLLSANTLPSSFLSLNSSSDKTNSGFLQFVNTNTSKGYPISKMNFTVTADDRQGSLSIKGVMPNTYSPTGNQETFSITYTNLNKASNYKFDFKTVSSIGNQSIKSILPSAITDGDIINNFISYTGFNSNDFSITKTVNDETGELTVAINLDKKYASEIGDGSYGFKNYSATKTFTGFMTKDEYNKRFDVQFVKDDDSKLIQLKQMQVSKIYDSFSGTNTTPLTVGNKTYNTLKDLIKELLVESIGTAIPTSWNDATITAEMHADNSQGTISFYVKIPKEKITGANSDINLVANYTGFVKGNAVQTGDNLSFVADNMLKSYLLSNGDISSEEEFNKFTPDTFAKWLTDNNNEKALKLISYKSGQYEDLLKDSTKYSLTVLSNPTQRKVDIFVRFNGVTNNQSLTEYSVTYTI
ncbi:hypothetical protein D8X55_02905 [Malacoplasma penetrans]|nr:lipoprotein 17-related variable surface protein [Malacoplasma penetrans]RXY96694.1 hypothetical protein D8X55_02905 [Malacoplasma penetrans]